MKIVVKGSIEELMDLIARVEELELSTIGVAGYHKHKLLVISGEEGLLEVKYGHNEGTVQE